MDVERHVRDEAALVLVPNPTTLAAVEAGRRGEVVELDAPAQAIAERDRDDRGSGRQGSRRVRTVRRSGTAPARLRAREARRAR